MFYSNFWIKIENHSEHLLAIFVMENCPSCWSFKSNALSSFCCIFVSSDYGSMLQWIKTDKFYVMLCKERVGNSPVHFESSSPTRYQKIWYCTRTTTWKCNCEAHEEDKKQGLRGTDMPSEVKEHFEGNHCVSYSQTKQTWQSMSAVRILWTSVTKVQTITFIMNGNEYLPLFPTDFISSWVWVVN